MSYTQIEISKIASEYQALARTFDSPTEVDSEGNSVTTDYSKKSKLYSQNKDKYLSRLSEKQKTNDIMISTFDNGILEGWEYQAFYNKVLADVKALVDTMDYSGEAIVDTITGKLADITTLGFLRTNTVKNKREAMISKLMRDIGLEYKS